MAKRLATGLALAVALAALLWLALNTLDEPSQTVVGSQEKIRLLTPKGDIDLTAKIDTGSAYSSIDDTFARSFGLEPTGNKITIITGDRKEERDTVNLTFILANQTILSTATLADRSVFSTAIIIGKADLDGFLVDPSKEFMTEPRKQSGLPAFFTSNSNIFGDDGGRGLTRLMLIIPILGSIVVLTRLLVGIRTFGMFAPVVIALSLLNLNIWPGLLIYVILVTAGIGAKLLILSRLKLPNIAELSLTIFVLVLVLFGVSALPFGFIPSFSDVFFRLIITTFIIEQASRTAEEHRLIDVLPLLLATFTIAVALAYYGAFLLRQPTGVLWGFSAASILIVVIAGNYLGLRFAELVRFKFLRKSHVHR